MVHLVVNDSLPIDRGECDIAIGAAAVTGLYRCHLAGYVPGMGRSIGKLLARYWGYLALVLAVLGLVEHVEGLVVLILAGGAFVYLLVQAPLWCGAPTRQGQACRNNSHGLLLGCWIREHKWQRLKKLFIPARWGELAQALFGSVKDSLASVSAVIAIGTFIAGAVGHL